MPDDDLHAGYAGRHRIATERHPDRAADRTDLSSSLVAVLHELGRHGVQVPLAEHEYAVE